MTTLTAFFTDVKSFATFNAKPHLFSFSSPYQLGESCEHSAVFIDSKGGCLEQFVNRVEQFGGVVLRG